MKATDNPLSPSNSIIQQSQIKLLKYLSSL